MVMRVRVFLFVRTEPDQVNDFKNAESVDDEERYEPFFLPVARRMPEGIALDDNSPEHNDDK